VGQPLFFYLYCNFLTTKDTRFLHKGHYGYFVNFV
jgi:hypothetical protein